MCDECDPQPFQYLPNLNPSNINLCLLVCDECELHGQCVTNASSLVLVNCCNCNIRKSCFMLQIADSVDEAVCNLMNVCSSLAAQDRCYEFFENSWMLFQLFSNLVIPVALSACILKLV